MGCEGDQVEAPGKGDAVRGRADWGAWPMGLSARGIVDWGAWPTELSERESRLRPLAHGTQYERENRLGHFARKNV